MTRTLVINTAFLGDVVFCAPLVDTLQAAGHRVHVLARPGYGQLLVGADAIDYDKRGADAGLRALLRLGGRLRAMRFDLVLGAHPSTRSGLIAALTRAPVRVGWGPVGYHRRVARGPRFVADARALAASAGVADTAAAGGDLPRIEAGPDPASEGRIALVPGSQRATKRWPRAHWRRLARLLAERGHRICWVGGPGEEGLVAGPGRRLFVRSLPRTAAALAGCAVAVGGDSGLLHLARAVGTPVVMLFGPTGAQRHLPDPGRLDLAVPDLRCRPCSANGPPRCPLGHHRCLADLLPETVLRGIQALREGAWPTAS